MTEESPRITLKQAADTARDQLLDLYEGQRLDDLFLEEITYDNKFDYWVVTIGFSRPYEAQTGGSVSSVFPQAKARTYKRITLDGNSGAFLRMTDRRFED